MAQPEAGSSSRLEQRFGNLTVNDGAFGFQGSVSGDVHFNHFSRDTRKNLAEAAFNAANKQHVPRCLEATREGVLAKIRHWADGGGQKRMYWLKGMAGTGKSTISLTLAQEYHAKHRLGASFFFQRGGGDLASAKDFAATVSSQLENVSRSFKQQIQKAALSGSRIDALGLFDQWNILVMHPLSKLEDADLESPIIVIADALDECDSAEDIALIIRLLARLTESAKVHIRVLITSRPEVSLETGFGGIDDQLREDFVLHDIEQAIVDKDIAAYYDYHLAKFQLPPDVVDSLVQRSRGLFIHAATVCRFVCEGGVLADKRLSQLLSTEASTATAELALDRVYSSILCQGFPTKYTQDEVEDLKGLLTQVLGSIATISNEMSVLDLGEIIALPENRIRRVIDPLHSVLDVPSAKRVGKLIRLIHPSFRDFLLNPDRHHSEVFSLDTQKAHANLFVGCMRLMAGTLRRNICRFRKPGTRTLDVPKSEVDKKISRPLQYACRYWIHHLQQSHLNPLNFFEAELTIFFRKKFLFWVEAMSWIGRLAEAISMLTELSQMIPRPRDIESGKRSRGFAGIFDGITSRKDQKSLASTDCPPTLPDIVHDAERFLRCHQLGIDLAPLQTYCSALFFTPEESIIRTFYLGELPDWVSRTPTPTKSWNSGLQLIEFDSRVGAVAFSPDGKYVAVSFRGDKTLEVVELLTLSRRVFERRRSESITSLSFSLDGQALSALLKGEEAAEIFQVATGICLGAPENPSEKILGIGLGRESVFVVSKSLERGSRLWDLTTSSTRFLLDTAQDDTEASSPLARVEFSPDAMLFSATREDRAVEIWHTTSGIIRRATRTAKNVGYKVFSSENDRLCAFVTIRVTNFKAEIWNYADGWKKQCEFTHHPDEGDVWCRMMFSPDCRFIGTMDEAKYLLLWDTRNGRKKEVRLKRPFDWLTPPPYLDKSLVAFSPNADLMACLRSDMRVSIWDIGGSSGPRELVALSHAHRIKAESGVGEGIAFSQDGERLITVFCQHLQIWDTRQALHNVRATTWTHQEVWNRYFQKLADSYMRIKMSNDGNLVSVKSKEGIEVWHVASGLIAREFPSDEESYFQLSPDGQLLAAGPRSWYLYELWNTTTGVLESSVRGGSDERLTQVDFSPDSRLVLSLSEGGKVRVRTTRGKKAGTDDFLLSSRPRPDNWSPPYILMAVSPTEDLVVFNTYYDILGYSGLLSGSQSKNVLKIPQRSLRIISISPCGSFLLGYAHRDAMVWDIRTGARRDISSYSCEHYSGEWLDEPPLQAPFLTFSSDGSLVAVSCLECPRGICVKVHDFGTGTHRDGFTLHRNCWFVTFAPSGQALNTGLGPLRLSGSSSQPSPAIFAGEDWIRNGEEDLVFLPPEHRGSILFVSGTTVFFGREFHERVLQFSSTSDYTFDDGIA